MLPVYFIGIQCIGSDHLLLLFGEKLTTSGCDVADGDGGASWSRSVIIVITSAQLLLLLLLLLLLTEQHFRWEHIVNKHVAELARCDDLLDKTTTTSFIMRMRIIKGSHIA